MIQTNGKGWELKLVTVINTHTHTKEEREELSHKSPFWNQTSCKIQKHAQHGSAGFNVECVNSKLLKCKKQIHSPKNPYVFSPAFPLEL